MSVLVAGTHAVNMDEPCWSLREANLQSPGSRGWRRYMVVKIVRGDKVVEFRRDMGPAKQFKVDEFVIPGGVVDEATGRIWIEHTVGELVDIAELLRSDQYDRPERPKPTDLIQAYREQPERRRLWRKRRSMVGPAARIQRG